MRNSNSPYDILMRCSIPKFQPNRSSYLLWFSLVIHGHLHPCPYQMKKSSAEIDSPFFFLLHTHFTHSVFIYTDTHSNVPQTENEFSIFPTLCSLIFHTSIFVANNILYESSRHSLNGMQKQQFSNVSTCLCCCDCFYLEYFVICFNYNCNLKLPNNT